jgi:hypothetical protein
MTDRPSYPPAGLFAAETAATEDDLMSTPKSLACFIANHHRSSKSSYHAPCSATATAISASIQRLPNDQAGVVGRRDREAEVIQRAGGVGDQMGGNLGVPCRGRQPGVTQQYLDDADVGASLEQVRRKTVP